MSRELFEEAGAKVISVVDTDNSSAVENVESILLELIKQGRADAFFTCGSNRLLRLMQSLGHKHNVPGQVAVEQVMVCGFGACYVCVRTFLVNGELILRRVCREGPVFNIQEAVGW
jgi:dihydroorotate dehydrogenase electron transfer subunit